MKKILFVVCSLLLCFGLVACGAVSESVSDYKANLESVGEKSTIVDSETIQDLANKFLEDIPDIALPKNVLISGTFETEPDIKGYLDETVEFDADKFAEELQGVVIEFDSEAVSTIAMNFKDDIIQAIEDEGIEIDDDIQVLQKGQYIYIGYTEFINATYKYTKSTSTN